MEESQVPWSDLPSELWPVIGERLHTYIDVIRFRSVCRLWRDSLPKLKVICPPMNQDGLVIPYHRRVETLFFQRIIYRFSPLDHDNCVCSKGWLCKMESANVEDMRFQRPIFSNVWFNKEVLKEVNFLDFGIEEVAKSYTHGFIHGYTTVIPLTYKAVVVPDWNCVIVEIHFTGMLKFRKHGDRVWQQQIGDKNSHYEDVIVYKGKIYTVDREGRVFLIDSSMELVQFSPPISMSVSGELKHLVECGGELYVVDRFVESKAGLGIFQGVDWCDPLMCKWTTIDIKVHMLDQNRNMRRWVEVKNLGNKAFVLGVDSFSVSAADVEGFEGNCIYFSHYLDSDLGRGYSTHVFHLQKRSIMESSLQILRAPLVLLHPAHDNSSSNRLKLELA